MIEIAAQVVYVLGLIVLLLMLPWVVLLFGWLAAGALQFGADVLLEKWRSKR